MGSSLIFINAATTKAALPDQETALALDDGLILISCDRRPSPSSWFQKTGAGHTPRRRARSVPIDAATPGQKSLNAGLSLCPDFRPKLTPLGPNYVRIQTAIKGCM